MSTNITFALVMIGLIVSIYLAGRIAERRGRSFKVWAWIAAVIGPLALPLVFLFPNLHRKKRQPCLRGRVDRATRTRQHPLVCCSL
jgi:MFS family permease